MVLAKDSQLEDNMTLLRVFVCTVGLVTCAGYAVAAGDIIGKVIAVRGKATIEREGVQVAAAVNSGIQQSDTIKTASGCRVKLLFNDDSVLTLGENSRLAIKEYFYSRDKGGKSTFNLLDGKMHTVVGKTGFEVQTPTAIAATRGTVVYFEVSSARK
jgi:hypothetical protein